MLCFWSSVNSVCSVGLPMSPVNLCKSVQSVGGLFSTLLQNRQAEGVLPQNSRNSQNRLVEMFSHRFHRFSQMLCFWSSVNSVCSVGLPMSPVNLCKSVQSVGGLFSTLLQNRQAEGVLPQNSRNSQNRLVEMFSHRFHRFSQMLCFWSSVNSVCSVGLPMSPVNLCKSVQSVGGLRRQVHPL